MTTCYCHYWTCFTFPSWSNPWGYKPLMTDICIRLSV